MNEKILNYKLKKIRFRANHRGTKELDHLISDFIKCYLKINKNLTSKEFEELEIFLNISDVDFINWIFNRHKSKTVKSCSFFLKNFFLAYIEFKIN